MAATTAAHDQDDDILADMGQTKVEINQGRPRAVDLGDGGVVEIWHSTATITWTDDDGTDAVVVNVESYHGPTALRAVIGRLTGSSNQPPPKAARR